MPAPDLLGTFEKAGGMDIKNNPGPWSYIAVLFIMICTGIRKTMAGSRKF